MDGKTELSFEEAWATIELMDAIEYFERDATTFWGDVKKRHHEYAAVIPICKPGQVRDKSYALVFAGGIWAAAKTWYYHDAHGSSVIHKTKEQAKEDIRRRFKSEYKRSANFRKAVNQFLQGEQQ